MRMIGTSTYDRVRSTTHSRTTVRVAIALTLLLTTGSINLWAEWLEELTKKTEAWTEAAEAWGAKIELWQEDVGISSEKQLSEDRLSQEQKRLLAEARISPEDLWSEEQLLEEKERLLKARERLSTKIGLSLEIRLLEEQLLKEKELLLETRENLSKDLLRVARRRLWEELLRETRKRLSKKQIREGKELWAEGKELMTGEKIQELGLIGMVATGIWLQMEPVLEPLVEMLFEDKPTPSIRGEKQ